MVLVFAIGYAGIIFEESLAFNKSGVGLLMAVCLWVIRSIGVRILMTSLSSQFLCFSAGYSATFADNGFFNFHLLLCEWLLRHALFYNIN